jgi:hypothetical protein
MQQIGNSDGGRPGGSVGVGRSRSGVAAASVPVEGGPTSATPVEATQQETWRPAAAPRGAEPGGGGVDPHGGEQSRRGTGDLGDHGTEHVDEEKLS